MLLLGGTYLYLNNNNQRDYSIAEAAEAQKDNTANIDLEKHIGRKIKSCCHLGPEENKRSVFIFYDSKNALHREYMQDAEKS